MIPLSPATPSQFTWSRLPRSRGYEVKLHGTIVGTLRRTKLWSSNYEAITSDGILIFRRSCWGTKVEIVNSTSDQQIALFQSGWRKRSTLTFGDGQRFYIERKGCWRPQWRVFDESGQPVLSLYQRERLADNSGATELEQSRQSLLILLILYRIRQAEEDAASATAAIAAVIASS